LEINLRGHRAKERKNKYKEGEARWESWRDRQKVKIGSKAGERMSSKRGRYFESPACACN
jgi:type IV secretory pathway TraG/TraD family ATPase VirD4